MGSKTKKQTSPEMKKKGSLLLFSILFFTSAWMFILGVLVGRGCAPLQVDIKSIQDRLAELSQKEQNYYKIDQDAASDKTSFGFYEDLKKTGTKDKKNKIILSLSSKKSFKKKYLVTKTIDNKKSDITPKNRTQKNYTIQVASLKDSKLADKLVAKLKKMRYPAYKSKAVIPGKGTWFRIRIGSYEDKADAGTIINRLQKDKFNVMLVAI
ncbi:MAG: SPOR domain-containing protein [Deltaproteobacteria bacterium]|nr:SPOR domain-containing protein [Deltaproteobacteria bacterium]